MGMKSKAGMLLGMAMMMSAGLENDPFKDDNLSRREPKKLKDDYLPSKGMQKLKLTTMLNKVWERVRDWNSNSSSKLKYFEVDSYEDLPISIKGTNQKNANKRYKKMCGEIFNSSFMTASSAYEKIQEINKSLEDDLKVEKEEE